MYMISKPVMLILNLERSALGKVKVSQMEVKDDRPELLQFSLRSEPLMRGGDMEILILLVLFIVFPLCISDRDTITPELSLQDGSVLLSKGNNFALGFFTPGNSSYRYVGIWYLKVPEKTVVWVANRDNPINGSSGVLAVDAYGNLVLDHPNRNSTLWSTNISYAPTNSSRVAKLFDSGNFLLLENDTNKVVWQSFDYPGNTMLPGMKVGLDLKSSLNRFLTSWKSPDDPGTGEFSFKLVTGGSPQVFLFKNSTPIWRTRPWPWTESPTSTYGYNYSFVYHEDEIYFSYSVSDDSLITRLWVEDTGVLERFTWVKDELQWKGSGPAPSSSCDRYGQCGANSNCDASDESRFECSCLPGFKPRFSNDWYLRDGSGGCVRKRTVFACEDGEGFLEVGNVKVPDTSAAVLERGLDFKACEETCLRNCSCTAFARIDVVGESSACFTWYGELIDTVGYNDGGADLYVRVDAIELAEYASKSKHFLQKKGMIAILVSSAALALFLMGTFAYWWLMKKWKVRDSSHKKAMEESRRHPDFPYLDLSTIITATNNFSPLNKLGQGGFGPVYKGHLPDGQEIAVKRLSKNSTQGKQEFKNEVALIANLQHQNLVKVLGSCIDREEMMLIYEYLPNKSLDTFIFDQTRKVILDWRKRFTIIVGIARGILYLHQDSALRIIHRDLKTSNILLDTEMNPKISDFGMAKIFRGDENQNNTKRVVGTYGYMSPEYAVLGKFSTKSDIFSFGVILLEIVSGKKNSSYYQGGSSSNLIGHAWDLWREDRALEIVDASLWESLIPHEALRCIHVGLLSVQESVTDRPTMLEAVLMLVKETSLPFPKQPAFIFRTGSLEPSAVEGPSSLNDVTISNVEAR